MQDYESKYSGKEIDAILGDVADKVDKVEGKGLSSEDFTSAEKRKLAGLENYDDGDLRKDLATMLNSVVEVRENLDEVTELANDLNTDIGDIYKTKQNAIADLDDIRRGAGKGDTSVQGVVVNNKQLAPDTKGNISLPKIPAEADIANMGFTKNKGTVTGVMVNGEAKLPNSNGVVDLGEIKVDEVKFANDLTGVVEATPEMFTYRPSAGDKSVRDESAVIRRIKGNTSVWGQFADISAPLTNSGNRYIITSNDDGSVSIKRDPSITSGYYCALNMDRAYRNSSHKYIFYADVTVIGVQMTSDYCGISVYNLASMVGNHQSYRTSGHYTFCCFGTPDTTTAWQFAFYAYGIAELTIHNLQAFDLTEMFGAGNEPTTYNEFRKYYPDAYYPYCAPEVRSMRATGIETIGFNAFNGEYAEVIGGHAYYLGGAIEAAYFATERGGEMKPITLPESRVMTFSVSGYIYATGSDICINLSHSGVRNGEHKPYEKNTLLLPEIAKYFPEGMHSIGDVCDEITIDRAVKRCATRAYMDGDENNAEVITDKVTTVYKLPLPEITLIDEPLQLYYMVDDFGTERMLSNAPSAPFKADIVYQFNAEGRIRDNSRNIEKLEELVKQPSDWLEGNPSSPAYIKNKPAMPTAIAPVTEVIVEYSLPSTLLPNVIHEVAVGLGAFTMPPLYQGDSITRNIYKMVFVAPESSAITFPYSVCWRDGVAPNWSNSGDVVEVTFTTMAEVTTILGEWKLYKL